MTDRERAQQEDDEYAAFLSETAKITNRILSARQHMGLSQSQMADIMGVAVRTVKKWEGPRYEELETTWPPETACRHATLLAGVDAMKKRLALDQ